MPLWKKNSSSGEAEQAAEQTAKQTENVELPPGLSQVKNIIAVASGKGGVGKSTVSTNLAIALSELGHKVGLMDADVYGPSQPGMLGASDARPKAKGNNIVPVEKHGISFMSLGLLTGDDSPVVWRAPIATRVISQFIANVHWGELDFLLIDLPPGTGDIQLTLSQQASLTGAVIVSTPQQVALGIAQKGLQMFAQVNIPILGIVENMSGFCCPNCDHVTNIFKGGGAEELSVGLDVPFLGSIPLDPAIMMAGDLGLPVLIQNPDSKPAEAFLNLAKRMEEELESSQEVANDLQAESYQILESGDVEVVWRDGFVGTLDAYTLRVNCRCALCVDEHSGKQILDPATVSLDTQVQHIRPIGRYALAFQFSDGHKTGIYKFERLRELGSNKQENETFSV